MPPDAERAFVGVAIDAACDPARGDEVLWGLEEEGVPGLLLPLLMDADDAVRLAQMAADASPLGLGVGQAADGAWAVWHVAIPHRPYLNGAGPAGPAQARRAGRLAARLAKRRPLMIDD